ncbi:MAG: protein kinase [Verrucomicrobiaceae bacterium]|nr:protein kinase [Verrucomicrobiaceae bacterium]
MPDSSKLCTSCGQPLAEGRRLNVCPACLTKGWQRSKSEASEAVSAKGFEIPGYEITGELARGGMGVVYRARQKHPQREVAVKMLMPQVSLDDMRERFRIEAKVMADLVHPGIMPIYQYGEHTGVPWISMALCSRGSLAQRKDEYRSEWERIAELMVSLAEAVAFAHARGVLHRDLKPGNVLFDDESRAFLSDFGLAKIVSEHSDLTRTISLVGTPHYLAPELINNAGQATTASDVYALGAILYELLAGKPVFDGQNVAAILKQIGESDPAPFASDVPRDLATITLKCLSKLPAKRYASAQSLADDLKRWLANEPIAARRLSATERLALWCKRKPGLAAMSVLLIGCTLAASSLILVKNRQLRDALGKSQHHLRTALLNEIRATRVSASVQGRHEALEAVKRAAMLGSTPELESEAASLLAMPSMRRVHEVPAGAQHWKLVPDEQIANAADYRDPSVVRIIELETQRELARLPGGDAAWGGQRGFSPDGRFLIYDEGVSLKTVVREWRTGRIIIGPLDQRRVSPRFSSDSTKLAAGLNDGRIEIYDLTQPGKLPVVWPAGPYQPPEPVGFSPDGRWLAVMSSRTHQVSVYGVETGRVAMTFGDNSDGVTLCGSWFGDSQGLMLGSYTGRVRSWIITSQTSRVLPAHAAQTYGVAVHPQGQLGLSSGYDGRTWIIDWTSGRALGMERLNSFMTRFSADGRRAVMHDQGQSKLHIYDVEVSDVCRQFTLHATLAGYRPPKGSWCAEVSPDGRLLACSNYGETTIYDARTCRYLGVLKDGGGNTQAWMQEGRELWIGAGRSLVRYHFEYDANGTVTAHRGEPLALEGKGCARFSPAKNGHWAVTMLDGICHGNGDGGDIRFVPAPEEMPASTALNPMTISPDGRWAVVSSEHGSKVGVYDLNEERWVNFIETDQRVAYAWFTQDCRRMWLSNWMSQILYDTTTWKPLREWRDREEPGALGMIQGSRDGRLMATLDGMSVVLRHGDTGEPFLRLRHPMPMTAAWLALTPNGRWLTYSALGHIQQVWDLANLEVEMKKLGLPWRGPHLELTSDQPPLTRLVVK